MSDLQIGLENASMDWEAKIPANRREMTIGAEKAPLLNFSEANLFECWYVAMRDPVPLLGYTQIHSLPRQIEGAKTRDIKARLQDFHQRSFQLQKMSKKRFRPA